MARKTKASIILGIKIYILAARPPWRNGLAHWTSASKVVGSSPTGGETFFSYLKL